MNLRMSLELRLWIKGNLKLKEGIKLVPKPRTVKSSEGERSIK
jgi:hypothetical protein